MPQLRHTPFLHVDLWDFFADLQNFLAIATQI